MNHFSINGGSLTVLLDLHNSNMFDVLHQSAVSVGNFLVGIDNEMDFGNMLSNNIHIAPGLKVDVNVVPSLQKALEETHRYQ